MPKLLKVIACLLLCLPVAEATTTVTANLKSALGTAYSADSFVRFRLRGYSGSVPRVSGGVIVVTIPDVYPDSSGLISTTLYNNYEITPAGTYWTVEYWAGGNMVSTANYTICTITAGACSAGVASYDLNTATANTVPPVVLAPTGDSTYARLDAGNTPFTGNVLTKRLEYIPFADQYTAATVPLQITAAANALGGRGTFIIPSGLGAGNIPTLPAGVCALDLRSATGNGQFALECNLLSAFMSHGFRSNIQNSPDGINGTAILGDATAAGAGLNIVGVWGQVNSAPSAGVYGINYGSGGLGGPGVQGDVTNLPHGVGVLGQAGGSNATAGDPQYGVKGKCNAGLGTNPAGTCIGLYAENDNGIAFSANTTGGVGTVVGVFQNSSTAAANLDLFNSTGNKHWYARVSGSADPVTGSSGAFSLYQQSDNLLPFSIAANAPNNTLILSSTGISVNGGTTLTTTNATGTGSLVKATSPALTTPALGVATATSVAVGGGSVLSKYQQLTAAITPASVSANTCAEQTFTVTGLTTADVVSVNSRSALTTMAFPVNYRPSAVDTLAITYCNPTAGAVTPTASTILLTAIR